MSTLKLNSITYSHNNQQINYAYSGDKKVMDFFKSDNTLYSKYPVEIHNIPESIAIIPFVCNVMPIAWYAGFNIEVNEIDKTFFNALQEVKKEFEKRKELTIRTKLIAHNLVDNSIETSKSAMLFSGGVDAFATYIRHFEETPDLITYLGADIAIEDTKQWTDFTSFVESEPLLKNNAKKYIESNLRDFYTFKVQLLLKEVGWWGKVQHGLSLIGGIAPLAYIEGYQKLYIASSYTDHIDIEWGSTPQIDENIKWGSALQVFHDGYELKRQDKVDLISDFVSQQSEKLKLRVCYSELRTEFNCSNCEKCFRTILGIILNNKNPNDYGFNVDESVYANMYNILQKGSASKGMNYFWWELSEKAKSVDQFFVFNDKEKETLEIEKIRKGSINNLLDQLLKTKPNSSFKKRLKFIIRNKFPGLVSFLKKMRT